MNGLADTLHVDEAEPEFVTVSVSRRVLPGKEDAYEEWVRGISLASAKFPGYMGVNFLRPAASGLKEYVTIYRFDNYEHCQQWEDSQEREEWVAKLDGLVEGETEVKHVTGLEFWFELPEIPVQKSPNPLRMSLVLCLVVSILVITINLLLGPWLNQLNLIGRTLIIVTIQVFLMTYLVMPRVVRILKHWLYS